MEKFTKKEAEQNEKCKAEEVKIASKAFEIRII